ncbi:MAG: hypothetical protein HY774_21000 [Acidobacteria bacterium]|nr:hypothetical protein [Acidobacteriota bacterium]
MYHNWTLHCLSRAIFAAAIVSLNLFILVITSFSVSAQQPPSQWTSRGAGGGGALFSPSINPNNSSEVYAASDLSALYRTTNFGGSWSVVDFNQIQSFHESQVQFTNDPMVRYCLDFSNDLRTPRKTTDGGVTWQDLTDDPTDGDVYYIAGDPNNFNRLIVTDYTTVYLSTNGGASFTPKFSTNVGGAGCHLAGAFFEGTNIYLGTNAGLVTSTDNGANFALASVGGIPAGQAMSSFAGAKQGATTRLFCVTYPAGDIYASVTPIDIQTDYLGVYRLDVGQPNWTLSTTGIAAGTYPYFVGMAQNNISVAYLGGASDANANGDPAPTVYKTTNGGTSWTSVLLTANNQNVYTGWAGYQGDRGWSFGEYALGFAVSGSDPNRLIITDFGHPHLSSDGGATWKQAYVDPSTQNEINTPIPKGKSYLSVGMEQTSTWWLTWSDTNNLFAAFTDIRGKRSTDSGNTWSFGYTGHTFNSMYEVIRHPSTGVLYGATSTVHDMYQSTYLTDSRIDGGNGQVLFSTNQGAAWQVAYAAGHPVICVAADPNNTNRLYASVIHSTQGGIFVSNNIQNGTSATWTKLTNPPRTQGHPFNIRVLNDGTLVCSYSGRRAGSPLQFQNSSGVFVSTNGGSSWLDRTDQSMIYWTKDVVIDPNDANQNTWYAGVWSGYGTVAPGLPAPQGTGGLYKTTNRGQNWTRILNLDRVTSCTISPTNPNVMYVTTEQDGLWYTNNLNSGSPTFTLVTSFPFRQPERVFFNPFNSNEIWVTTFGSGLWRGMLSVGGTPPSVNNPSPSTICSGGSTTFSVTANGSAPLAYQWQVDTLPINGVYTNVTAAPPYSGTNTDTLTITGATAAQAGNYRVVVSNGVQPDATSQPALLTVDPLATANAGPDQTICSNQSVTLAGSVGGGAASGTWSGGAGTFTPNATTLNAVYTPTAGEISAGSVTLTLTTNDPAGPCGTATDTVIITISPAATANAGPDQTICSNQTVTLAGSVGGSAASGTWSGGAGTFTPNPNALNAVYTPSAGEISAGSVTLTLTTNDPTGPCGVATDTVVITINAGATVNAGPDQTVCASSPSVTLAGSFGGLATSATWTGGGGTFNPNASTVNAVYTPSAGEISAGSVTLTLTTNDPTGPCGAATDTITITISPAATANAGSDQTICSNQTVTLAGSVGGSAASGTWSGGAGTFTPNASALNAVYTPSAGEISAGSVTLTLTTNDPTGPCGVVTDTVVITINAGATVNAGSDQSTCAGGSFTLAGSFGGAASSATWSGGTGTFSPNASALNATYTPSPAEITAGGVTLTLTTNDPTGPCGTVSDTVLLTITPGVSVNAGPDQTKCASSPAVTLAGSIGNGATSATWSGGAGTFSPDASALNAVYTPSAGEISAGSVTLTLTTNDPTGPCGAVSDTVTITISPAATVNAGPDQTVCSGNTIPLNGSFGGSATSATWTGGGGTFTPNASSLTAVYTPSAGEISAGSVTLTLTTNDPAGTCGAVSDTVTITINPGPSVNAGPDQTVCATNPTISLGGSFGGGATTVTWTGGTGTFNPNPNTPGATYTPSAGEIAAGSVVLTLTTNDPAGPCGAVSDTVTITITPAATVNAGPDQTICGGSTVSLAGAIGGSAGSATWSGGSGTYTPNFGVLNATYTPSAAEITAGTVTLTLTTNDPAGPCGIASDTVTITINPAAAVNAGPDQAVCASNSTVTLAGTLGGSATSGTWSGGGGTFVPNNTTLNATYTLTAAEIQAGTVILTLTTNDPAGPCGATTDSVTLTISPSCSELAVLYVADTTNNRIQKFDGQTWSMVGGGGGSAVVGHFRRPEAVVANVSGTRIYVADTGNNRIQWSTDGGVTWSLFASNGIKRNQVKGPQGLALDAQGNLYVADTLNNRVLRFNGGVPGLGIEVAVSGSSAGQVKLPGGLAVDAAFTLFITDVANSRILKLVNAHTVPGSGSATPLATAGTGANQVRFPQGVAVDNAGNLYVADTGNSRILQFTGGQPGAGLILATVGSSLGQVRDAEGVTVSAFSTGNFAGGSFLVVGDTNNNRIQGRFLSAGEWVLVGSPNGQGGNIGQFRTPSKIR